MIQGNGFCIQMVLVSHVEILDSTSGHLLHLCPQVGLSHLPHLNVPAHLAVPDLREIS